MYSLGHQCVNHRVSKKTLWKFNRLSSIINVAITIQFLHRTKEQLFSFSMIRFLNRNDEKWPHTRQIKIASRNHIRPPLGIDDSPLLRFRSALHCGYSGITDKDSGLE